MPLWLLTCADSFAAAAALGLVGFPRKYERPMATAIGFADAIATFAARGAGTEWPLMAAAGCVALCVALMRLARRYPGLYCALPLLLSCDNLVLRATTAAGGIAGLVILGLCSGALALVGFAVARMLGRPLSPGVAFAGGIVMLAILFVR